MIFFSIFKRKNEILRGEVNEKKVLEESKATSKEREFIVEILTIAIYNYL